MPEAQPKDAEVRLAQRPDGVSVLLTPHVYADGDAPIVRVEALASGGWRLSDQGHALMRISTTLDVDEFLHGPEGARAVAFAAACGVAFDGACFTLDAADDDLQRSGMVFGDVLVHVDGMV